MYQSIRNSHIPPPGIWTFQFSCGQIPNSRAKNPFKCPTSRLNSVVKCPPSGPLFLRKSDVIWAEISVSSVFPDVTNRNVMSATLNIQCSTKHKIEATNQIPHPSGVVVKCPTTSSSSINDDRWQSIWLKTFSCDYWLVVDWLVPIDINWLILLIGFLMIDCHQFTHRSHELMIGMENS